MNKSAYSTMLLLSYQAKQEYQMLVRSEPENPEGYYGLGTVHLDFKQPEEAIRQFKKAEELYLNKSSPLVTDVRYQLGLSYLMLEQWSKAKEYFELIYPQVSDNPRVNFFLGIYYLSQNHNNFELAKKYLNRARELGVEIPTEVLQELNL